MHAILKKQCLCVPLCIKKGKGFMKGREIWEEGERDEEREGEREREK